MRETTTTIRVSKTTRWALKIAGAKVDCSIIELLARVERGDLAALRAWREAAAFARKAYATHGNKR